MKTVNGADIEYEVSGDGPPIVFIHGMNLCKEMWRPQVNALESSHTVLRYNLRGHGESESGSSSEYSYELFADDLEALLDELGLEAPVICGHSIGSVVAIKYAMKYPDKLSRLVLAGVGVADSYVVTAKRKLKGTCSSVFTRLFSDERAKAAERYMINLLSDGPNFDLDEIPCEGRVPPSEMERYSPLLEKDPLEFDLSEIRVPTLILNGEYEPFDGSSLAEDIPDVTWDTVSEAGHVLSWNNPKEFTSKLVAFLSNDAESRIT